MMNFMFARDLLSAFGLNQKKINQILNKEGETKLEELLMEEETVSECKQQNAKLLEFICKKENLLRLIHYSTRDPQDPDNKDASHKFPFVSTDILTSCLKVADKMIEIIEVEDQEDENNDQDNDMPSLEIQLDAKEEGYDNVMEVDAEEVKNQQQQQQLVQEKVSQGAYEQEEQKQETQDDAVYDDKQDQTVPQKEGEGNQGKVIKDQQQQDQVEEDYIDLDENIDQEEAEASSSIQSKQPNSSIQVASFETKKTKQDLENPQTQNKQQLPKSGTYDFSLMDELFALLDQESEIQPILCGYFNKIVQSYLGKIKQKMLNYLLLHRKGDVFIKLLNHLQHHSLSLTLIELLQLQIVNPQRKNDRFSSDFNKDQQHIENSEEEKKETAVDPTADMNDEEKEMYHVLQAKKQEVIWFLISKLGSQNKDIEQTLNAHTILQELTDNENTFGKLVEKENLIMLIKAACDINNTLNQGYALSILISIIKEFPEQEKQIGYLASEFTQTIGNHFLDITYSCLLVIRQPSEEQEENQSGFSHRKFGHRRLKALELIRQELQTLCKYVELNSDQYISAILRKQLITTVLDIIETFPFCSIANQQGLLVLDFLKKALDEDELQLLKSFVQDHLSEDDTLMLTHESGRPTSKTNVGSIIQLAIALMRQTAENEEHDGESHHRMDFDMEHWNVFCDDRLRHFELKWTKKLEDYGEKTEEEEEVFRFRTTPKEAQLSGNSNRYENQAKKDNEDQETLINNLLQTGKFKNINIKSKNIAIKKAKKNVKAHAHVQEEDVSNGDSNTAVQNLIKHEQEQEYYANQYWKVPDSYNLEELLDELD